MDDIEIRCPKFEMLKALGWWYALVQWWISRNQCWMDIAWFAKQSVVGRRYRWTHGSLLTLIEPTYSLASISSYNSELTITMYSPGSSLVFIIETTWPEPRSWTPSMSKKISSVIEPFWIWRHLATCRLVVRCTRPPQTLHRNCRSGTITSNSLYSV